MCEKFRKIQSHFRFFVLVEKGDIAVVLHSQKMMFCGVTTESCVILNEMFLLKTLTIHNKERFTYNDVIAMYLLQMYKTV